MSIEVWIWPKLSLNKEELIYEYAHQIPFLETLIIKEISSCKNINITILDDYAIEYSPVNILGSIFFNIL